MQNLFMHYSYKQEIIKLSSFKFKENYRWNLKYCNFDISHQIKIEYLKLVISLRKIFDCRISIIINFYNNFETQNVFSNFNLF